jgi:diguanylate cyclase (GGDEF)-like protein
MYDPLIVDTFIRVHRSIEPVVENVGPTPRVLREIVSARNSNSVNTNTLVANSPDNRAEEMLALFELAHGLAGQISRDQAGDIVANHVRKLVPCSLAVVYLHDILNGDIEARYVSGQCAATVKGMRIPLGQKLSGWVAANRQIMINSDAALDLSEIATAEQPTLKSCLSAPLVSNDQLVGALSLYSAEQNAFTEDHRRIVGTACREITRIFKRAVEFDKSGHRDELTGLPSFSQFEKMLLSRASSGIEDAERYSLLFIDVVGFPRTNQMHGRHAGDEILRYVARQCRSALRVGDILFRHTGHEFIAFLAEADSKIAALISQRIESSVSDEFVSINGSQFRITIEVAFACYPRDGRSIADLLAAARAPDRRPETGRVH